MTDIKPMWRIQRLTELFGPAGIGWNTKIKDKQIIEGANGEKIATVDIDLYVKVNDEWSEAIEGTGGSSFVSKEKGGLYTSDECFKMAYTDALSVACKALGMGADVYWGDSKYQEKPKNNTPQYEPRKASEAQLNMLKKVARSKENFVAVVTKHGYTKPQDILAKDVDNIKADLEKIKGGEA